MKLEFFFFSHATQPGLKGPPARLQGASSQASRGFQPGLKGLPARSRGQQASLRSLQ